MAFKLTEKEQEEFIALKHTMKTSLKTLLDELKSLNDLIDAAYRERILPLVEKHDTAADKLHSLGNEIASRCQDEYSTKSDKWRDSPRGEAVQDWITKWEDLYFEEIDGVDFTDMWEDRPPKFEISIDMEDLEDLDKLEVEAPRE